MTFIPVDRPRMFVSRDGMLAAIQEPARITIIALPTCEAFGTIETSAATAVAWLGDKLLVLAGVRARLVDPRAAKLVVERRFDEPLALVAYADAHVLATSATATVVLDDELRIRPVRVHERVVLGAAVHTSLVGAAGDAMIEIDPVAALNRRTWRTTGTLTAIGGNLRNVWRTIAEMPARITVTPLVVLGQPTQHELPEPLVAVVGHPRSDVLACRGASGALYAVDLTGKAAPRTLAVAHADALALVVGTETYVLVGRTQHPTQCLSLAPSTWRDELIAWTRSGVVENYPVIAAIAELANQLELEEELVPAITLCYGAYLCGAPGVPPHDLAEVLGGRWPDEVRGAGFLAESGLLRFTPEWISLAPAYCRKLDDVASPPT
ncbi:MAG: hypothetical protein SFX73_36285 [Kofleriaceae bacterium]|nr:hypothetical protein [Kofleriaceae bacterium]